MGLPARRLEVNPSKSCRTKFLRVFRNGFYDPKYLGWERDYKVDAHRNWQESFAHGQFETLLSKRDFAEIANRAVRVEGRTHLLFSFEKMALRDALKTTIGAKLFAEGLYAFLYEGIPVPLGFERMNENFGLLPAKQTRVRTWPVLTVFGFLANPKKHIFVKPNTLREAAQAYGFDFEYSPKPSWGTYASVLKFARLLKKDLNDLRPRDMIDIQSFIWVIGSSEYREF